MGRVMAEQVAINGEKYESNAARSAKRSDSESHALLAQDWQMSPPKHLPKLCTSHITPPILFAAAPFTALCNVGASPACESPAIVELACLAVGPELQWAVVQ